MNRHLGLFLLTVLTCTAAGGLNYFSFALGFSQAELIVGWHGLAANGLRMSWLELARHGLWFSVPFLGFLTAHEFGHYFAARWHGLRPSLPYYLPAPLPLTGSLGAVIVFRGQFPNRRVLFDFAAGGPLAGFVVAVDRVGVRPGLVAGREAAGEVRRRLDGRAAAVPVADACDRRPRPGRLVPEPSPDRARRLARPAVHDDEPGADQPARRWTHRLCGDSPSQPLAHTGRLGDAGLLHRLAGTPTPGSSGWSCSSSSSASSAGSTRPASMTTCRSIRSASRWRRALIAIFVVCFMPVPLSPIELIGGR